MESCDTVDPHLPGGFPYTNISSILIETSSMAFCDVIFDLEVRVNVFTIEDVKSFLGKLNESSGCTFNTKHGRPDKRPTGEKARTKICGYQKCSMNVHSNHQDPSRSQDPGKNTNCPASVNFRLETPLAKTTSMKQEKEDYPLWINIHF